MPAAALVPVVTRVAGGAAAGEAASGAGFSEILGNTIADFAKKKFHEKASGGNPRQGGSDPTNLWTVTAALDLLNRADSQLPSFQHVIDVSVSGGPKADLGRIWTLALSTAFGRYRQAGLEGIQGASLEGWWDITEKIVRVRLSYQNSGLVEIAQNAGQSLGLGGVGVGRTNTTSNFLLNGPTQETVGDTYASWIEGDSVLAAAVTTGTLAYVGGLPARYLTDQITFGLFSERNESVLRTGAVAGALAAAAIRAKENAQIRMDNPLSDAGRLITTTRKGNPSIQPPAPSGDGLSRTSPFVALVSNALTDPGYLPASPPQIKRFTKKPIFFARSIWSDRESVNQVIQAYNRNTPMTKQEFGDTGDILVVAADGYDLGIPGKVADLTGIVNSGV